MSIGKDLANGILIGLLFYGTILVLIGIGIGYLIWG